MMFGCVDFNFSMVVAISWVSSKLRSWFLHFSPLWKSLKFYPISTKSYILKSNYFSTSLSLNILYISSSNVATSKDAQNFCTIVSTKHGRFLKSLVKISRLIMVYFIFASKIGLEIYPMSLGCPHIRPVWPLFLLNILDPIINLILLFP